MKILVRLFGVSLAVLFLVLMIGKAGTAPAEQDPLPNLGKDVSSLPGPVYVLEPTNFSNTGLSYLKTRVGEMKKMIDTACSKGTLTPDMVPAIAAVYGANGNFTGHDGLTYKGKCEISLYFYKLLAGNHKITDFHIQIKVIYAKEFTERMNTEKGDTDVIHSFYFILASSFKLDGKQVDPPGSTNCRHARVCDCNNGL
jgi:hypothetical protein